MSGVRERLLQIRVTASPRRINEAINPTVLDAERVLSLLPSEVVARTDRGGAKIERRKRFLKNIQELIDKKYTLGQLLQLSEGCIDNQGRIDEEKFINILSGKEDD